MNRKRTTIPYRRTRLIWSVLIALPLFPSFCLAQQRMPIFQRVTNDQGLSQNFVTSIVQDRQGFLWFGTRDGLNRYDGYDFTVYRTVQNNAESLNDNSISSLAVDREGIVWVGTAAAGLSAYDPGTNAFLRFRRKEGDPGTISSDRILAVFCDSAGRLWVGTPAGLDLLDPGATSFAHYAHAPNDERSLPEGMTRTMREDANGNLLVGSTRGLSVFASGKFTRIHLKTGTGTLSEYGVFALLVDRGGKLWVATSTGTLVVDWVQAAKQIAGAGPVLEIPAMAIPDTNGRMVYAIEEEGDSRLWFATSAGLYIYDAAALLSRPAAAAPVISPLRGMPLCMLRDRSGNFWIGTNGAGVEKQNRALERFAHILPNSKNPSVRAVHKDPDGRIWIGSYTGLDRYDPSTRTYRSYPFVQDPRGKAASVVVRSIYQDPLKPSVLWIGTQGIGLYYYDRMRDEVLPYPLKDEDSGRRWSGAVWSLLRDRDGTLWLGTINGLRKVNERTRALVPISLTGGQADAMEPSTTFLAELPGRPGWLWLASENGLYLVEKSSGRHVLYTNNPQDATTLSHRSVTCITEDRKGAVWIGTVAGLNQAVFADGSAIPTGFRRFTSADGLPNDCIYGVLEDESGRIWMSTNKGISRLDPSVMVFRNYDISDGLQSNEFNSGAFSRAGDGEMFFGGINGFNAFHPASLTESSFKPPIVLTDLQVSNQQVTGKSRAPYLDREIAVAGTVRVSYEDRVVSFGFASLDYTAPQKNKYACMMQGFDKGWLELGTQRRATYMNLSPGNYRFLVRASNSDGVWSPVPASIQIIVTPPYWQTWWFRIGVLAAFVLLAYAAHRSRTNAILQRNLAMTREIDQRKRTEMALQAAEEKYRSIFERSVVGIFQTTPEGHILSVNPRLASMLGYDSPEELMRSVTDVGRQLYADPQTRDDWVRQLQSSLEVHNFPCQLKRKDGSTLSAMLTGRLVKDPNTSAVSYEGMIEDVTERKRLEEQLLQAHKMESVGRLAGGIAHDFNNMLTVVEGYVELALEESRGHASEEYLRNVFDAAETAKKLTAQLLTFARKQIAQPVVVSPNRLLLALEPLLRQLIGEDVLLKLNLDPQLWNVRIDPSQFEQIIMNLGANARDAMRNGGTLQIESGNVSLDSAYADAHMVVRPGPYVLVTVSDTGKGIGKDILPHIFEPFYTTKDVGQGTGLGLATVYGIVKQNGGNIWVYSEIGKGTTFKIYLPRTEGEDAQPGATTAAGSPRGTEVILIVEDEKMICDLAASVLRSMGHMVLAAADGHSALKLAEECSRRIDLLITDVVMPGMNGKELASELLRKSPATRVLYTSGYTENMIAHHGVLDSGVEFLPKPYTPRDLMRRVRKILDQPGGME